MKLNNIIEPDPSSTGSDDFQEFESYQSQQIQKTGVPHSGTSDSIAEGQFKGTPSMTSSGYGSQAVSTLTLSSEDSLSLRSNEDSEVVKARRSGIEHTSSGESDGDELVQSQSASTLNREDASSVVSEDSQNTVNVEGEINGSTDSVIDDSQTVEQADICANNGETLTENTAAVVAEAKTEPNDTEARNASKNIDQIEKQRESLEFGIITKDLEKDSLSTDSEEDDNLLVPESLALHISEEDLREKEERNVDLDKDHAEPKSRIQPGIGDDSLNDVSECDNEKDNVNLNRKEKTDNDVDISLPMHKESMNKVAERTRDAADSLKEALSNVHNSLLETPDGDSLLDTNTPQAVQKSDHTVSTSHKGSARKSHDVLSSEALHISGENSLDLSNILGPERVPSTSDSSSAGSRGALGSDSIDPYSLEAMDELERLGAEFGEDNSEFMSMDEKQDNTSMNQGKKSLNQSGKGGLDDSLSGYDKAFPKNQSTPKGIKEGNQRPVSCVVFSHKDLDSSMHEAANRLSGDFSDTVSGKPNIYYFDLLLVRYGLPDKKKQNN